MICPKQITESSTEMTSQPPRNRGRWSLDFTRGGRNSTSSTDLPNPPGYSASITSIHDPSRQNDSSLRAKRLWDMALGPIKQVSFSIDNAHFESEPLLSVKGGVVADKDS